MFIAILFRKAHEYAYHSQNVKAPSSTLLFSSFSKYWTTFMIINQKKSLVSLETDVLIQEATFFRGARSALYIQGLLAGLLD